MTIVKASSTNSWARRSRPTATQAEANYGHGTRARYVFAKCRCLLCRAANSRYQSELNALVRKPFRARHIGGNYWIVVEVEREREVFRSRDRAETLRERDRLNASHAPAPSERQLVPAKAARAHIVRLQNAGVGFRAISIATGLRRETLRRIANGDIRRVRRRTAKKILAVPITAVRQGAHVSATPIWNLLARLITCGYTKKWIARNLGKPRAQALQIGRMRCTARNARAVLALYQRIFEADERLRASEPPGRFREILAQRRLANVLDAMPAERLADGIERILRSA